MHHNMHFIHLSANAHNYAFTVYKYNVISSSAKDNSDAFCCCFSLYLNYSHI